MRFISLFITFGLLISQPAYANDKVNIFACEPEWASLAQEIGGDKIKAFAATSARQDPHHVRAKPSLIAAMRRADLVVHPQGNPHVQLNPHNIALVAKELTSRLSKINPANAAFYNANYADFIARWNKAITGWEQQAASLRGKPVVVHHKSFIYLLDWLKMKEVASLEPKPGLPPTTAHLESLLQKLQASPASVIIRTPYEPDDASEWLSEKTGTPAIILPFTIDGDKQSNDLFGLFDSTIKRLKEAVNAK